MGHEDFERPPVTEVSLGAVFGPVQGFSQAHVGLFWEKLRADFPVAQDQPPVPFPQNPPPSKGVRVDFSFPALAPLRRTWFTHRESGRLIQFQQDGLILNWRKTQSPYPRYNTLRDEFGSIWQTLVDVTADSKLEPPTFTQAQVTYSNVFELPSGEPFGIYEPSGAITKHSEGYDFNLSTEQENCIWRSGVSFAHTSEAKGTLTCQLIRGGVVGTQGSDRDRIFFQQTFQSFIKTDSINKFLQVCDNGHDVIVENFSNLLSTGLRSTFGGNRNG